MRSGAFRLPRLYAILDRDTLVRHGTSAEDAAKQLVDAGCALLQYRNKVDAAAEVLATVERIQERLGAGTCQLLLNDRVDLAVLAGWDGAHVGQTDLAPADARRVLGPDKVLGVSTHTLEQLRRASETEPVDYVAVGPVFATGTKADADPVVGIGMVREARSLTAMPLVAIGGISERNAAEVMDAGAEAVAVISALFVPGVTAFESARRLLRALA